MGISTSSEACKSGGKETLNRRKGRRRLPIESVLTLSEVAEVLL